MKKKERHQELLNIEEKYLLLKGRQELSCNRKNHLADIIENSGSCQDVFKECPHLQELKKIASNRLLNAEFSILGSISNAVALTAENSALAKISAQGMDISSGEVKILSGVICADFTPGSANVSSVSLYWSCPDPSAGPSVAMLPSVSVLSFES